MPETLATSPIGRALGVALFQFLWQGTAIGALAALALVVLRRTSPHTRYLAACCGLFAMLIAPVVTASRFLRDSRTAIDMRDMSPGTSLTVSQDASNGASGERVPFSPGSDRLAGPFKSATPQVGERYWLAIVTIWAAGVLLLSVHLLVTWLLVERIRRRSTRPLVAAWPERALAMAAALRITRPLHFVESSLVSVPTVIGWMRPMILLPASALSGLSPSQLEAVMAHELAHIRRHDYLVNLLQSAIETLLFFHPAVWWLSTRIRIEREHCCDDVAVELCGDRLAYADALTSLAELQLATPAFVMAANGGHVANRIRRVLGLPLQRTRQSSPWLIASVVVATLAAMPLGGGATGRPEAQQTPIMETVETTVVRNGAESQNVQIRDTPLHPDDMVRSNDGHDANQTVHAITMAPTSAAETPVTPRTERRPSTILPNAASPRTPVLGVVQTGTGRIVGTVTDESGAVIPDVAVYITQAGHDARIVKTGGAGTYTFANLPPATYDVRVEVRGFKSVVATRQVDSGKDVRGDIQLRVGSVTEAIDVTPAVAPDTAGALARQAADKLRAQINSDPRASSNYLDLAKLYYQQGRYVDADNTMTLGIDAMHVAAAARDAAIGPSLSAPGGPVRIGGDITPPKKIRDVSPIYPADAQAAGATGLVIIEARIATDGTVEDATILRHVPMLDEAALGAIRQWIFEPTMLNGVPVEVLMTVTVNFTAR